MTVSELLTCSKQLPGLARLQRAQPSAWPGTAAHSPQINKLPKSAGSPRTTVLVVKLVENVFSLAWRYHTALWVTAPYSQSVLAKLGGVRVCCKARKTPRGLKSGQATKTVASLAQIRHLWNTCKFSTQSQRLTSHRVQGPSRPCWTIQPPSAFGQTRFKLRSHKRIHSGHRDSKD